MPSFLIFFAAGLMSCGEWKSFGLFFFLSVGLCQRHLVFLLLYVEIWRRTKDGGIFLYKSGRLERPTGSGPVG